MGDRREMTEAETRAARIDEDLRRAGWSIADEGMTGAVREFPVEGMAGTPQGNGRVDYVLFGTDGLPLAAVEAKRWSVDPEAGRTQASLYADCLERRFGRRPVMFLTNGAETTFWDDLSAPPRPVSGMFTREDLERMLRNRERRLPLQDMQVDMRITNRAYQLEAIRAVCEGLTAGRRRHLLVMATGTGKTRTAASLVDLLSRAGWVTNVLFLADRLALVRQAKEAFKQHLPELTLCNLCEAGDDAGARVVLATYPTMMNAIDAVEGARFSAAHFDLIVVDEAHRSIFKKYRAIFEYFDAILVGLTATPKTEVNRNTYGFFGMKDEEPTFAYEYETAVNRDKVLVPYHLMEVKTERLERGIVYDDLSERDKERYDEDWGDEQPPPVVEPEQLNRFIFNADTVDLVLQDVMDRGIKVAGGDTLGKTIIFAQNARHARFIEERFNVLYPYYKGTFARCVIYKDCFAQTLIDRFKEADKMPQIAISVDMMDTGIDVPECVNLVFFKRVYSKAKFWQMIGRGTRLCPGLDCLDGVDGTYVGKRRFYLFDYCDNCAFFRLNQDGQEGQSAQSLSETLFTRRVALIAHLQDAAYGAEAYQTWRSSLAETCRGQVTALNPALVSVRLRLRAVSRYREAEAYVCLSEGDVATLSREVAPLVREPEADEATKRFDALMYGVMLSKVEGTPAFAQLRRQVCTMAKTLMRKASIPQIAERLETLRSVGDEAFWEQGDLLAFERARLALRELARFLEQGERHQVFTDVTDRIVRVAEGGTLPQGETFDAYHDRVERYLREHAEDAPIYKLTHNLPLTAEDFEALERILFHELGTKADYDKTFPNIPLGLMVRRVAHMDREAVVQAFATFINAHALNQSQIAFVQRIITYVTQNGAVEDFGIFARPPFDRPARLTTLFGEQECQAIGGILQSLRENALTPQGNLNV